MYDLEKKISELNGWINDVEEFLDAEHPAVGDREALSAQLDQSKVRMLSLY